MNPIIHNLLKCCQRGSKHNPDFARGVLVGLVNGMLAAGVEFPEAIDIANENLPREVNADTVPLAWFSMFGLKEEQLDGSLFWVRKHDAKRP